MGKRQEHLLKQEFSSQVQVQINSAGTRRFGAKPRGDCASRAASLPHDVRSVLPETSITQDPMTTAQYVISLTVKNRDDDSERLLQSQALRGASKGYRTFSFKDGVIEIMGELLPLIALGALGNLQAGERPCGAARKHGVLVVCVVSCVRVLCACCASSVLCVCACAVCVHVCTRISVQLGYRHKGCLGRKGRNCRFLTIVDQG